jgi:ubiquinone/menaquinone biosynthesis C-methylase UbiE
MAEFSTLEDARQDANALYSLGSSRDESARLQRQAIELAADSMRLLDGIGVKAGHTAIDLGCGPRGILDLLAERVSPGGHVVGLDADQAHTAMAVGFVRDRQLSNVEIVTADARRTGLPSGAFDLVFSRTLLINIPEPAEVVREMVRLAKPGGQVAAMEYDMEFALCHPPHPAFDSICHIFTTAFRRNGADPWIGRKLPQMFSAAGLAEIEVEVRAPVYAPGHSRRTIRADLVLSMRPHILELGLATAAELDQLDAAARGHLANPTTIAVSGLLFLARGRKPT